jgi:aminoglycoside phosphotransferase (APT) family kinase protein
MPATDCQPHSRPLSSDIIDSVLSAVTADRADLGPTTVRYRDQHSNDVAEVELRDGRTLMVKRGRYEWTAARFRTSRLAAGLVGSRTTLVVPRPLPLPGPLRDRPLEAYWRVELPTLQDVWPSLPEKSQQDVLRSWGELLRDLHVMKLSGHGPLADAPAGSGSLSAFLYGDLGERLLPAVHGCWSEGAAIVDALIRVVPAIAGRVADREATFLHNDVHMGNVLSQWTGDDLRCVGLIDLEGAYAGPAEADLANAEVLHGPLFAQPLWEDWFEYLREGYSNALDPHLLGFYRAYHLVNLGFYSALVGHAEHAAEVAAAARSEVDSWVS